MSRILTGNLATIRKDIKDGIISTLKTETNEAGVLSDVRTIHYGEKINIAEVQTPIVWIIPQPHTPDLRGGHTAIHDFTFDFIQMIESYEPDEGEEKADDLTARVYDVMVDDRTLGGLVYDIRPTSFDPSYQAAESNTLFWGSTQFVFRIQRRE